MRVRLGRAQAADCKCSVAEAPTRGRTIGNVVARQAPQVVSRSFSGAGPPGSKPCSVATPSRGSPLSVAEAGEARLVATGAAESREARVTPDLCNHIFCQ
eukprot:2899248-Amphidinium_carterae.1